MLASPYVIREHYSFKAPEAKAVQQAFSMRMRDEHAYALDRFCINLRPVWSKLDCIRQMGGLYPRHTSADALINIRSPGTHNAGLLLTPTFAFNGFTTNGVDNAVDQNFNPATAGGVYARDSALYGFRTLSTAQFASSLAGWVATNGTSIVPRGATDHASFRVNQNVQITSSGTALTTAAALVLATRTLSNAVALYIEGRLEATGSNASTAMISNTLYLGSAGAGAFRSGIFVSDYIGGAINATEAALITSADYLYNKMMGVL